MRAVIIRLTHKLMVANATVRQLQVCQVTVDQERSMRNMEESLREKERELAALRQRTDDELARIGREVAGVEEQLRREQCDIVVEMKRRDKIIQGQRKVIKKLLNSNNGGVGVLPSSPATIKINSVRDENRVTIRDTTNLPRTNNRKNELPSIYEEMDSATDVQNNNKCYQMHSIGLKLLKNHRFIKNNKMTSSRLVSSIMNNSLAKKYCNQTCL